MRLTFVLPFYSSRPIGGLRVVYELANGLVRRGHSVTVIHPWRLVDLPTPKTIKATTARLIDRVYSLNGVNWMKLDKAVELLHVGDITNLSVPNADVIFATNWHTANPVLNLDLNKGRKHYLVADFYPYLASKEILEDSWRSGFKIATISNWLAEMVVSAGVAKDMVTNISCGVSSFHTVSVDFKHRQPSIVMMYGTTNYKAAHDGLLALKIIHDKHRNIPIRMFGPNYSRRPKNIPDWAEYHARLPESGVSRLYNKSSIFLSSSLAEGFCLPAAEAMASGCAVVATECGGNSDFASHEKNCLLSEPAKPHQLANNVFRLLDDDSLRLRLAAKGLESISTQTWAASVDRLEKSLGNE